MFKKRASSVRQSFRFFFLFSVSSIEVPYQRS